jgi:hypothetical protein
MHFQGRALAMGYTRVHETSDLRASADGRRARASDGFTLRRAQIILASARGEPRRHRRLRRRLRWESVDSSKDEAESGASGRARAERQGHPTAFPAGPEGRFQHLLDVAAQLGRAQAVDRVGVAEAGEEVGRPVALVG